MLVELAPTPSHISGPTWTKTVDGSWYLPELSLGWGVIDWWHQYVKSPGGDTAGEPFMPTLEQARFVLWWYAVDQDGNYSYREGCLRRMKGAGKDPLAAALSLAELCGPVAFSHFEDGQPVGKRRHAAWVQIAAVSQEQTKNTFRLFPIMISKQLKKDYSLDTHKFLIYTGEGGTLESVTASPASMEGNRPTFVIENETQWWGAGPSGDANDGHAMNDVIEGNVAKIPSARKLAICNAHIPGYDTVAERVHDHYVDIQTGRAVDTGLLYDALEAPADTPVSEIPSEKEDPEGFAAGFQALMDGLKVAAGDSYWLPLHEIAMTVLDVKNSVIESRRKFLNQVNAHEDAWITPQWWDRCRLEDIRPLEPRDRITMGFDGSKSSDWSALVACRVEDGALFTLGFWDPTKSVTGEIPRDEVDACVRSAFATYEVVAFRADVKEFEAYVDQWSKDFRRVLKVNASPTNAVAFDMRGQSKRFSFDCERFLDAVIEHELVHDGNPMMRQHILNARRHPTNWETVSIRKASKESSRKIDIAVCCVLAYGARYDFQVSKKNRKTGTVIIR